MRSHAVRLSPLSLLVLVLLLAGTSALRAEFATDPAAPFLLQASTVAPLLPGGVEPMLPMSCTHQITSNGSGATTSAACMAAYNSAVSACMDDTQTSCCSISACQGCVAGGASYSCWVFFTERIPKAPPQ